MIFIVINGRYKLCTKYNIFEWSSGNIIYYQHFYKKVIKPHTQKIMTVQYRVTHEMVVRNNVLQLLRELLSNEYSLIQRERGINSCTTIWNEKYWHLIYYNGTHVLWYSNFYLLENYLFLMRNTCCSFRF